MRLWKEKLLVMEVKKGTGKVTRLEIVEEKGMKGGWRKVMIMCNSGCDRDWGSHGTRH